MEAHNKRVLRANTDPGYLRRVDPELNRGRINILVFTSGETHEPPLIEWGVIASPSIVSIDYVNEKIDIISFTHDIRAPEVEEALGILGQPNSAQRLDQALLNEKVGGFNMTRRVFENATGLAIDFQVHSTDAAVQKLTDNVFHGVTLDLPIDMRLGAYYYRKVKYDEEGRQFVRGKINLDGRKLIGFIKATASLTPKQLGYSPLMEHNERKALFFKALRESMRSKLSVNLIYDVIGYTADVLASKDVSYDFDQTELVVSNLGQIVPEVARMALNRSVDSDLPPIRKQFYIVDQCCSTDPGNMPVHWANWIASDEENIRKDWKAGVFKKDLAYEVPYGGNPYGDLVTEYWPRVRVYVRRSLLER